MEEDLDKLVLIEEIVDEIVENTMRKSEETEKEKQVLTSNLRQETNFTTPQKRKREITPEDDQMAREDKKGL